MNKYLARMLAAAAVVGPALTGCNIYRNWTDPCWPQRYSNTARKSVIDAFAPQVQNGQVLDQTVWNYYFNAGTDELNSLGRSRLDYIVRRRPAPDPNIFLQTAHDIPYELADPAKFAELRRELDLKRIAAVQRYLESQTVGRPMQFEFAVHDPHPVGTHSAKAAGDLRLATTPTSSGVLGSITTDSGLGATTPSLGATPGGAAAAGTMGAGGQPAGAGGQPAGAGGSVSGGGSSGTQPRN